MADEKNILVTGTSGWLGKRLVSYLQKKNHLVRPFKGDVTQPDDCETFCKNAQNSTLIHTAGVIHPGKVKDFYAVNVIGTENIIKAAIKNNLKRVVIISSNSPIGCNASNQTLFDETSAYNPYMHYGKSKMAMEKMCKQYQNNIDLVIIRPPWFYGPDQPPRQTLFFNMIRTGKFPLIGNGQNLRSMVYIDNLCDGIWLAATVDAAKNNTYWIADKHPYSMLTIVNTIKELLDTEFQLNVSNRQIKLPYFVGTVAEYTDKLLQACGVYQQKIHVLSELNKTIACSTQKAQKELGYAPKVALKDGMRQSIQWCLDSGFKL